MRPLPAKIEVMSEEMAVVLRQKTGAERLQIASRGCDGLFFICVPYMVTSGMEKTTLYLSGELQRSLLAMAKREGRSQAEIIRSALDAYLSVRAPLRLRSIGAGSDNEVSGANSEEWLRRNWNKNKPRQRKATK